MAGKLIIHIGHYKTGTTALQVFCTRNEALLQAQGLDYPAERRHNAKHSVYAFALLRAAGAGTLMHGYASPTPPEELWEELFAHVRASPARTVLISSEEFMRLAVFPVAEARLAAILARHGAGLTIEALAYLRGPQGHLRSWYNQLVKMRQVVPDYDAALREVVEPIHLDYGLALAPWRRLLGDSAVILRPYRPRAEGALSIFADFCAAIGQPLPADADYPDADPNPRLDDRVAELVRQMQNAGHPPRVVNRVRDAVLGALEGTDTARSGAQPEAAFDALRRKAAAGIAALSGLPRSGLDLATLQADLPQPMPPASADSAIMVALLSEIQALRARLEALRPRQTEERLARLEAAVQTLAGGGGAGAAAERGPRDRTSGAGADAAPAAAAPSAAGVSAQAARKDAVKPAAPKRTAQAAAPVAPRAAPDPGVAVRCPVGAGSAIGPGADRTADSDAPVSVQPKTPGKTPRGDDG